MPLDFIQLPQRERNLLFSEAGLRAGMHPVVMEKDFWVCWMLEKLFSLLEISDDLVFKGGTSLSKVFNVIDRFSEDIDLGLSPGYLGFSESEISQVNSRSKGGQWLTKLQERCGEIIQSGLLRRLENVVVAELGPRSNGEPWLEFLQGDGNDSANILFHYPTAQSNELGYVEKSVKLEFGSLADQIPIGAHRIHPWLEQVFPGLMADWTCEVRVLEVERTFWEKSLILHKVSHLPPSRPIRDRYARHYSDFAALWKSRYRNKILGRIDLLERSAWFQDKFFGPTWARCDTAKIGTLRLLPSRERLDELARDYDKMEGMFIKPPPDFTTVLEWIAEAETEINSSKINTQDRF